MDTSNGGAQPRERHDQPESAQERCAGEFDPTELERHWQDTFRDRPYVDDEFTFDDYGPAYSYGSESWVRRADRKAKFDEVEHELAGGWESVKARSRLTWQQAREAARDAWDHVATRFGRDDLRADDDGMALDPRRSQKKGPVSATSGDDARSTR